MNLFSRKYTPRWIVFLIDVFISTLSISLAYMLRFNFEMPGNNSHSFFVVVPFVVGIRIVSFIFARTYSGIVRYTGLRDAQRIFLTVLAGSVAILISNLINYHYIDQTFLVPVSIVIIDFMTTVFLMLSLRWLVKAVFYEFRTSSQQNKKVVIYGDDENAVVAKQTIEQDIDTRYRVVAFITDGDKVTKKKIEGIGTHPLDRLTSFLDDEEVNFLLMAKPFESLDKKKEIIELCLSHNVRVLTMPSFDSWVNGELSPKQIKRVRIEDLLERNPIHLDKEKINSQVKGKVVMVTGAAGSIGSEMVRQLVKFKPKELVLFDQAETPLYDVELILREQDNCYNYHVVIGDIADANRVDNVYRTFKPEIVYHAAAYKHVPMMENNPAEAIRTNILGTKTIADAAVKYKVKRFVMVSTDKAVNPTNIMGASKRIAEIYTQSLNKKDDTLFITTRFGNVLGSNGSVIPRFRKQIEEGGPITVTHPQITRFFMTIPEACQLVLEAGAMGNGGEIFIFDMGKSVRIVDLAKKMIKLSGLELGKDIQITYTGLRPGEKLYEELLADEESTLPTHHSQIMVAKVAVSDYNKVSEQVDLLVSNLKDQNNIRIVDQMKKIVPEFISQNSIYEQLDKKPV